MKQPNVRKPNVRLEDQKADLVELLVRPSLNPLTHKILLYDGSTFAYLRTIKFSMGHMTHVYQKTDTIICLPTDRFTKTPSSNDEDQQG